ncbi:hypothetical protein [Halobiforma nitratireducens]|uniref:Uncharacterized protein n=1 Tax=Halobiforma nitratireducens JCM 10879 TaxID=1227454 RepID=M0LRT8_9EURY|nr:hypothetical protein [Halobiforma nitratireducens]EMA35149.1 hypothetical protein C446_13374 [Halobiforma nitratireducens JCM 10879]
MIALGVALTATVVVWSAGWLESVPAVTLPVTGSEIDASRVVFISGFLVGLFVGGCYLLYRTKREAIRQRWEQYSTWAKAMISGWVAALSVALVLSVGYVLDWLTVTTLLVGVLLSWPLAVGTVLLGYRKSTRASSTLESIKIGYVLTRGLESRTLSMIVGLLVAIGSGLAIGGLTWYFDRYVWWIPVVFAGLLWGVVTLWVYNRHERRTTERTDLVIAAISTPESRDVRELTVRNVSGRPIELSEALIRDTDLDLYRPGVDTTLRPGEEGTFEIEQSFSLEPNDDAIRLPLGYNLKRGGETPAVFTKTGEVYFLQWAAQPAATIGRDSSKHVVDSADQRRDERHSSAETSESVIGSAGNPTPQD